MFGALSLWPSGVGWCWKQRSCHPRFARRRSASSPFRKCQILAACARRKSSVAVRQIFMLHRSCETCRSCAAQRNPREQPPHRGPSGPSPHLLNPCRTCELSQTTRADSGLRRGRKGNPGSVEADIQPGIHAGKCMIDATVGLQTFAANPIPLQHRGSGHCCIKGAGTRGLRRLEASSAISLRCDGAIVRLQRDAPRGAWPLADLATFRSNASCR